MTTVTSASKVEFVETIGKIFAGIGLSLLIMKRMVFDLSNIKDFFVIFIITALISILLSFFIQNMIIRGIVASASNEKLAKSLLIAQVNNTVLPYYNDEEVSKSENLHWWEIKHNFFNSDEKLNKDEISRKDRELLNTIEDRNYFYNLAASCHTGEISYEDKSKLDKAFFPFMELGRTPFKEDAYKKTITSYTTCLLDDKKYADKFVKNIDAIHKLDQIYEQYDLKMGKYNKQMYGASASKARRIQKYYDTESKRAFLSDNPVPPNLSRSQFFKNKDVKKYIIRMTDQDSFTDPTLKDLAPQIKKTLPDSLLKSYNRYRPYIGELNKGEIYEGEVSKDAKADAKRAYKSIILPIVGLSLSIFFMVLNILSLISMLIFQDQDKNSKRFVIITLCCLLIIPTIKMVKTGHTFGVQTNGIVSRFIMNNIYYYQGIIMKTYKIKD